ncbi:MAG: hypothetical protein QXS02_06730, partial [Candidatus Thermoplasmatota archaeon]
LTNPGNHIYNYIFYPSWIYNEIATVTKYWWNRVANEVKTNEEVNKDKYIDEVESTVVSRLYSEFINKRGGWESELASTYKDGTRYKNTASKVLYHTVIRYLNKIESILRGVNDEVVKNAIDEALDGKTTYDSMKSSMQQAKNLADSLNLMPRFPLAFVLQLKKDEPGYSGWTERFQCAVVQKPSFFAKEYYEKYYNDPRHANEEKCNLKYQNINIFSPGAGISSFVDRGFDALNKMVCRSLDAGFDSLETELMKQNAGIRDQVRQALDNITNKIYDDLCANLGDKIIDSLEDSAIIKHLNISVDNLDIGTITSNVLSASKGNGNANFASDLNTSKIARGISDKLQKKINDTYSYLSDEIEQAIKDVLDEQVFSVYTQVVSETISVSKELLKEEYGKLSKKLQNWANDQISQLVSSYIPAGLFILPYIGWVCTLNVWYIDVSGQIPFFQVVDTFDETMAHPFWGHTAQEYTRKFSEVKIDTDMDGNPDLTIGYNRPVDFEYKTATLAIVLPDNTMRGMGDRIGGWEEISIYP